MNKRTKLCAALVAAVMAIGLMCFGFAQWSSDITLNGSVSGSGKWDVKVTDASVELSNAGAEITESEATYNVVVYSMSLKYIESTGWYTIVVDDLNAETISVTAEQFAEYDQYVQYASSHAFTSGNNTGWYRYMVKLNDTGKAVAEASTSQFWTGALHTGENSYDGQVIGQAIGQTRGSNATNDITMSWYDASNFFASNPAPVKSETTFSDTSVNYAAVNFSLPGAWANYKVTITNNGTANANLADAKLDFSALDESVYSVDTPDLSGKVLAPGESCTINLVVKVIAADSFDTEAVPFTVTLSYVQDSVNEAPSAGYTQG